MKYTISILLILCVNAGALDSSGIKKVFFIVGPVGSDKTTVADLIKNKPHKDIIEHYSVGNLLRLEAQKDTEYGRMIKNLGHILCQNDLLANYKSIYLCIHLL